MRTPSIDVAFDNVEPPGLTFTESTEGQSVVVAVAGDLDVVTSAEFSRQLSAALSRATGGLVCDLTRVNFLGAAALSALLVVRQEAIASDTKFDLVCPQQLPRRVFAIVGLDTVFTLHEGVAAAAEAQAAAPVVAWINGSYAADAQPKRASPEFGRPHLATGG